MHYSTRRRGPGELARFLAEHEVQHLGAVPSLVRAMLDADPDTPLPALRWVTFTGDILHRDLVMTAFDRIAPDAVDQTSYGASELGGVAGLEMRRDTVPDGDIVPVGFVHARVEVEIEDPDAEGVGRHDRHVAPRRARRTTERARRATSRSRRPPTGAGVTARPTSAGSGPTGCSRSAAASPTWPRCGASGSG